MAHGNKPGGGGGGGAHRKRASHRGDDKGRRNSSNDKRRRRGGGGGSDLAPTAPDASAAFLAALEAQRAKQSAAEQAAPASVVPGAATANEGLSSGTRAAFPGFYFDEAKCRYFKVTKQQQQQQRAQTAATREKSELEQRQLRAAVQTGRALRRRGWMAFLAERQCLAGGAVHHRDRRELMPRFFASRLSHSALSRMDVGINPAHDRFSAVDISPDSSTIFVGYATGCVRAFGIQTRPRDMSKSLVELGTVDTAGMTVSSIRRHARERGILISAVGARVSESLTPLTVRGGTPGTTGRVGLFSDSTFRQQPHVWKLNDPWVVEWCPQQANLFSVGLGSHHGAALVDCSSFQDGQVAMTAPIGRIKSDTLSQTFSQHTSAVIVNGSRNGSWWTWDTRAPRRATEVTNSRDKSPGSILCLRLLQDERRLVTQWSDGELAVIDLRSAHRSPVTLLCRGEQNAYRSMLGFDVDDSETVVACATRASVALFDVSSGAELSQLRMPERGLHAPDGTSTPLSPAEHVILRENRGEPTLWALSNSALYQTRPNH